MINVDVIMKGYDFWDNPDITSPKYGNLTKNIIIVDSDVFPFIDNNCRLVHEEIPDFDYLIFDIKSYLEYLKDFNFPVHTDYGEDFWTRILRDRITEFRDVKKVRIEFQDKSIATMIRMML